MSNWYYIFLITLVLAAWLWVDLRNTTARNKELEGLVKRLSDSRYELRSYIGGFLDSMEKKVNKMKELVPDHKNISRFEADVALLKSLIDKAHEYDIIGNDYEDKE